MDPLCPRLTDAPRSSSTVCVSERSVSVSVSLDEESDFALGENKTYSESDMPDHMKPVLLPYYKFIESLPEFYYNFVMKYPKVYWFNPRESAIYNKMYLLDKMNDALDNGLISVNDAGFFILFHRKKFFYMRHIHQAHYEKLANFVVKNFDFHQAYGQNQLWDYVPISTDVTTKFGKISTKNEILGLCSFIYSEKKRNALYHAFLRHQNGYDMTTTINKILDEINPVVNSANRKYMKNIGEWDNPNMCLTCRHHVKVLVYQSHTVLLPDPVDSVTRSFPLFSDLIEYVYTVDVATKDVHLNRLDLVFLYNTDSNTIHDKASIFWLQPNRFALDAFEEMLLSLFVHFDLHPAYAAPDLVPGHSNPQWQNFPNNYSGTISVLAEIFKHCTFDDDTIEAVSDFVADFFKFPSRVGKNDLRYCMYILPDDDLPLDVLCEDEDPVYDADEGCPFPNISPITSREDLNGVFVEPNVNYLTELEEEGDIDAVSELLPKKEIDSEVSIPLMLVGSLALLKDQIHELTALHNINLEYLVRVVCGLTTMIQHPDTTTIFMQLTSLYMENPLKFRLSDMFPNFEDVFGVSYQSKIGDFLLSDNFYKFAIRDGIGATFWNMLKTSSLIGIMYSVFGVVSYESFTKVRRFFNHVSPTKEEGTVVNSLISFISTAFERIHAAAKAGDWKLLFGGRTVSEWLAVSEAVLHHPVLKHIPTDPMLYARFMNAKKNNEIPQEFLKPMTDDIRRDFIVDLISEGNSFLSRSYIFSSAQVVTYLKELTAEKNRIDSLASVKAPRITPFGIYIYGPPNTGKSALMTKICIDVARANDLPWDKELSHVYQMQDNNYHDTFAGSESIMVIDDPDNKVNKATYSDTTYFELTNQVINNKPYNMESAAVESKGTKFARFSWVFFVTNFKIPRFQGLTPNPGAFYKRFKIRICMVVKKEFSIGNNDDVNTRVLDADKAQDAPEEGIWDFYVSLLDLEKLKDVKFETDPPYHPPILIKTYPELMQFLQSKYKPFIANEEAILKKGTAVSSCPKCFHTHEGDCQLKYQSSDEPIIDSHMIWTFLFWVWFLAVGLVAMYFTYQAREVEQKKTLYFNLMQGLGLGFYQLCTMFSVGYFVGFFCIIIATTVFTDFFLGARYNLERYMHKFFVNKLGTDLYDYMVQPEIRRVVIGTAGILLIIVMLRFVKKNRNSYQMMMYNYKPLTLPQMKNAENFRRQQFIPVFRPQIDSTMPDTFLEYCAPNMFVAARGNAHLNAVQISGKVFMIPKHFFCEKKPVGAVAPKDFVCLPSVAFHLYNRHRVIDCEVVYGTSYTVHPTLDVAFCFIEQAEPVLKEHELVNFIPPTTQSSFISASEFWFISWVEKTTNIDKVLWDDSQHDKNRMGSPCKFLRATKLKPTTRRLNPRAASYGQYIYPAVTDAGDCGGIVIGRCAEQFYLVALHTMIDPIGSFSIGEEVLYGVIKQNIDFLNTTNFSPGIYQLNTGQLSRQGDLVSVNPLPPKSSLNAAISQHGFRYGVPLGTLEVPIVGMNHSSKVKPTEHHLEFEDLTKEHFGDVPLVPPPVDGRMIDDKWVDPYVVNLRNFGNEPVNHKLIDAAVEDYVEGVENLVGASSIGVFMTFEEAVVGIPGVVTGVDLTTSSGPPLIGPKRNYMDIDYSSNEIFVHEEVKKEFDIIMDQWEKGIVYIPALTHTKKDEPISLTKANEQRVRIFNNASMAFNLALKCVFGPLFSHMVLHKDFWECLAGINMAGYEVDMFVEKLKAKKKKYDGDGQYFDIRQGSDVCYLMRKFFSRLCDKLKFDSRIRLIFLTAVSSCYNTLRIINNDLLLLAFTLGSGLYVTLNFNSIFNSIIFRVAYIYSGLMKKKHYMHDGWFVPFRDLILLRIMGDDNIRGCDEGDLTFDDICEGYALFGIKYTNADKTLGEKDQSLEDVQVLKRNFWFDEKLQRWKAKLEMKSIVKMLTIQVRSPKVSPAMQSAAALSSAVRELYLHGPETFNLIVPRINKCAFEYGYTTLREWQPLTYEECELLFIEKRFFVW
jgi:hypothetical protein